MNRRPVPGAQRSRARRISRSTAVDSATCSDMNAVPRSNDRVVMATFHPSLTSPTTFVTGISTSS